MGAGVLFELINKFARLRKYAVDFAGSIHMVSRKNKFEIGDLTLDRFVQFAVWWPREVLWRIVPESGTADAISFPFDTTKLQDMEIRWPKTYEWTRAGHFVDDIVKCLGHWVAVHPADIQQVSGIVMIQAFWRDKLFYVAIDYSDDLDYIDAESLKRCTLYFKMQYRRQGYAGYGTDTPKIIPGGYVVGHPNIYHYLPHIRKASQQKEGGYDVFGRFGRDFAQDVRQKAVALLQQQTDFRYSGGLRKVRYSYSLLEAGRSKVCIDLPGNGDFCFRLVDYFAVGACVISRRHRTRMPVELENLRHIVYTKDDLSDLLPLCKYYLENDDKREEIGRNARDYFDLYLHRKQLAAYYLQQCVMHLGAQD
jgi:glycosyl transferase family 1